MPKIPVTCPKCYHEFHIPETTKPNTAICPKCGSPNEDYIREAQEKKTLKRIEDDKKRRANWD